MGGRVTETKPVTDLAVGEYLSALAAATPVPGGGSAAALTGAMGSALLCMVARIALRRAKDEPAQQSLRWLEIEFERCIDDLEVLSQEDIDAYHLVVVTRKESGKESRQFADAVVEATRVPLDTADAADRALRLAARLRPLASPVTASDFESGCDLLEAAFKGGIANAAINIPDLHPDRHDEFQQRLEHLTRKRADQA